MRKAAIIFSVAILVAMMIRAVPAEAGVVKAVFYPSSGQVYEKTTVQLKPSGQELSRAVFRLPGVARPESLLLGPLTGKARLADLSWESVKQPESEAVSKLRSELASLEKRLAGLTGEREAAQAQIKLWTSQQVYRFSTAKEAQSVAQLAEKSLPGLFTAAASKDKSIKETQKDIDRVRKALDQASGEASRVWEVTASIADAGARSLTLTYSYVVGNCGWRPFYRIEALPKRKSIAFAFEAEVWQGTGADFSDVEIFLATSRPSPAINPPGLPDWIIRPRPEVYRSKQNMEARAMPTAMALSVADEAAGPAPEPEKLEQSTFALWRLGKRALPAGEKKRLTIRQEDWPAVFSWLLRPSLTPVSYLRAEVKLDEARDLPSGKALFLVDGALLATRGFAFTGTDVDLYFGKDQLVTAEMATLQKQSGEEGFLSSSQTYDWSWSIKVKNAKGYAVPVRVEEPKPQSRSKKIELELKASPEPDKPAKDEDKDLLVWSFEAGPKSETGIKYSVHLTAPEDMKLDLGWK